MAKFIAIVSHKGPITADYATSPRPTRRCSGCRPRTTARGTMPLLAQNIVTCTHYQPDFDALRAASTRIVIAAGVESDGELAHRAGEGRRGAARHGSP